MRLNNLVHFFEVGDEPNRSILLVDNYNGRIGKIDHEMYKSLVDHRFHEIPDDIFKSLCDMNIIVNDDFDEYQLYEGKIREAKKSLSTISLTLTLTRNCNFSCIYCYEGKNKTLNLYMSKKVINQSLVFLKKLINSTTERINVTFYGGEPLLNYSGLKFAVNQFKDIHENVNFDIITNGYLLNEKIISFFKENHFKKIQITLDGPPEVHNKMRPLKGGGATFKKILENILNVNGEGFRIIIRSNLSSETISYYSKLLSIFENYDLKKTVILNPSLILSPEEIQKYPEVSLEYLKAIMSAKERGFTVFPDSLKRTIVHCGALTKSSYVIDYNGKIYTCYGGIGDPNFDIGDVFSGVEPLKQEKFLRLSPMSIQKCRTCPIVGFCGGGCIYSYYLTHKKIGLGECPSYRYGLSYLFGDFIMSDENG